MIINNVCCHAFGGWLGMVSYLSFLQYVIGSTLFTLSAAVRLGLQDYGLHGHHRTSDYMGGTAWEVMVIFAAIVYTMFMIRLHEQVNTVVQKLYVADDCCASFVSMSMLFSDQSI